MSRMLKVAAFLVAIVAVLILVVSGTVYAFSGDRCGSGDSSCDQQNRAGCIGQGRCAGPGDCTGAPGCDASDQP